MNTTVIESKQSHETGVGLEPSNGFAVTPHIEEIVESALAYLQAGYPYPLFGTCLEQEKRHWPSTLLPGLGDL